MGVQRLTFDFGQSYQIDGVIFYRRLERGAMFSFSPRYFEGRVFRAQENLMGDRFRLTCQCSRSYPIETRQAGQTIECECGEKLLVPTMMKIKKLPLWVEEEDAPKKVESESIVDTNQQEMKEKVSNADAKTQRTDANNKVKLSSKRLGLFIVCAIIFLTSVFFICKNLRPVDPRMVFYKQTTYSLGDGTTIKRDSSPITQEDYNLYFFTDFRDERKPTYAVNDEFIEVLNPFIAYQFFEYVKDLSLSENFYDNFNALKTRRLLRLFGFGFLALASLTCAMLSLFLKESTKQVGAMRGNDWR